MAKTKKPGKLPKKIAGVKVPKELRKSSNSLLALVNQPVAPEIAVAAALAALNASKDVRKAARQATTDAPDGQVSAKVDWVGPAVAAAATEIGRRLLDAYHEKNAGVVEAQPSKTAQVIRIVEKLAATKRSI